MPEIGKPLDDSDGIRVSAANPERLQFMIGEVTGGGPVDGKQMLCMSISPLPEDEYHNPVVNIFFSKDTALMVCKAMAEFLHKQATLDEQPIENEQSEDNMEDEEL